MWHLWSATSAMRSALTMVLSWKLGEDGSPKVGSLHVAGISSLLCVSGVAVKVAGSEGVVLDKPFTVEDGM